MSYSNIIYILTDPTLSWDFEPPFSLSCKSFLLPKKISLIFETALESPRYKCVSFVF